MSFYILHEHDYLIRRCRLTSEFFRCLRRRFPWNVHDGRPEEVLRSHEENGLQEAAESHPEATGECFLGTVSYNSKLLFKFTLLSTANCLGVVVSCGYFTQTRAIWSHHNNTWASYQQSVNMGNFWVLRSYKKIYVFFFFYSMYFSM